MRATLVTHGYFGRATGARWREPMKQPCHAEFPDYPLADLPALPEGFSGSSWHNETCPSYLDEAFGLQVFMDYVDVTKREYDGGLRFSVIRIEDSDVIFMSDNWTDVLNFVQAERDRMMDKEASDDAIERRAHDENLSRD